MRDAPEVLEIRVSEVICFGEEFTAPSAVMERSPFFQPKFTFVMADGGEGESGNPRGPTVFIDFDPMAAIFE